MASSSSYLSHSQPHSDAGFPKSLDTLSNADSATVPPALLFSEKQHQQHQRPPSSWRKSFGLGTAGGKRMSRATLRTGGFTFYREESPSASMDVPRRPGATAAGGATTAVEEPYDYRYDHVAPPAPLPEPPKVLGLKRRTCQLLGAVLAIIIILAVALGVGLGVGLKHKSSDGPRPPPPAAETNGSPSGAPSSAIPTSTSAPSTDLVACPAANNTIYKVPDTNSTFLRECGIDYSGIDQAKDIASVWTMSMQDCMFQCAEYPGCEACGWGVIENDPGSLHRCWLKSGLKEAHKSRPGWEFAYLQK